MPPIKRVLSVSGDCHAQGNRYAALWRKHFYEGVKDAADFLAVPENLDYTWARGSAFTALSPSDRMEKRARVSEQLRDQILKLHAGSGIDAVISYIYARDVDPGLIREITARGIPWINFWCDSLHMFEDVAELVPVVTLNWFPERSAVEIYRTAGGKAFCKPYPLNPTHLPDVNQYRRSSGIEPATEMAFVGFPSANRITILGQLLWRGASLEVRGHGWGTDTEAPFASPIPLHHRLRNSLQQKGLWEKVLRRVVWPQVRRAYRGPVEESEFLDFLAGVRVLLGLNEGKDKDGNLRSYLKFRDVEFPAHGCCYLSQRNEDLLELFEDEREILTFANVSEAVQILKRLRRHPEECQKIGTAGRLKALAECGWAKRLDELSKVI